VGPNAGEPPASTRALLLYDGQDFLLVLQDFCQGGLVLPDYALVGEDQLLIPDDGVLVRQNSFLVFYDCGLVGQNRFLVGENFGVGHIFALLLFIT
jgi:hypothetical protein